MIEISTTDLELVKDILRKHIPDCEVIAYGSRVTGKSRRYSDLDLSIIGEKELPLRTLGDLQEDFEESDLPFRVDLHDWWDTSETFREIIKQKYVTIQKAKDRSITMF